MAFGLSKAPSTFQETMNNILSLFIRKFVLIFFYDIHFYSQTQEDHLAYLHKVLTLLELFTKESKCEFAVQRVAYLNTSFPQRNGRKYIKVASNPRLATSFHHHCLLWVLRPDQFLPLLCAPLCTIVRPLIDLLRHQAFVWNDEALKAFQILKEAVITLYVLGILDFSASFDVTTDASGIAVGAILSQNTHPMAPLYFGKTFSHLYGLAKLTEVIDTNHSDISTT